MYDFLLNITISFIYIGLFHQIYFEHNIRHGCFVLYHEEDRPLYDRHRTLVFVMFVLKQPFTHLCSYENLWSQCLLLQRHLVWTKISIMVYSWWIQRELILIHYLVYVISRLCFVEVAVVKFKNTMAPRLGV